MMIPLKALSSFMGPTAGIGDAFFFNCLRVIAAGIAIGLCSQANSGCSVIYPDLWMLPDRSTLVSFESWLQV